MFGCFSTLCIQSLPTNSPKNSIQGLGGASTNQLVSLGEGWFCEKQIFWPGLVYWNLDGGFKYLLCSPLFGEDSHFD